MSGSLNLRWSPPGPVAARYLSSRKLVSTIQGPVGSGKTSASFMKAVTIATQQRRSTVDGVRRTKMTLVRDTYRQLWRSTIPSWWKWLPQNLGDWVGAKDGPARHTIRFQLADQSVVEFIAEFVAIGDLDAEAVMRGYEPTFWYLNEADLLHEDVFAYAVGRAGRYPGMNEGGPSWYGVIIDMNAPDPDGWAFETLIETDDEAFDYFCQPGGMDPNAENRDNLPGGYYENQIKVLTKARKSYLIDKLVHNRMVPSRDGKPVYQEYNHRLHASDEELEPVPGLPLIIGADAGGTPAAVFMQQMPNGQWCGLDELVAPAEETTGAMRFGEMVNQRLRERFHGFDEIVGWGDPSATYGGDSQASETSEKDWLSILSAKTGIAFRPAPSNAILTRLEAVKQPLHKLIDGHHPGLLLSKRMKITRRGFASGYRYKKVQGQGGRYADKPEKNEYSHPHDALQYAMLGGGDYAELMARGERYDELNAQTHAIDDENPGGQWDDGGRSRRRRRDRGYAVGGDL